MVKPVPILQSGKCMNSGVMIQRVDISTVKLSLAAYNFADMANIIDRRNYPPKAPKWEEHSKNLAET